MTEKKIKIGATYASKHETWGPICHSHVTEDGVHIFSAIGRISKANAQFDETGRCVFYDRGMRTNPITEMIEPIGYYRNSKPFLRRRVAVEGEEVFEGFPIWVKRPKTTQEINEDVAKIRNIARLGAGIDFETSWPNTQVSHQNTSNMIPEQK